MESAQQVCFFNCTVSESLTKASSSRILTIIDSSRRRGDGLHVDLERRLANDPELSILCHRRCVSTYTSKTHIARCVSAKEPDAEPPAPKRIRRSNIPDFDFQKHCLFCGSECTLERDGKHPDRWRRVVQCRTAERGTQVKTFKETIVEICQKRHDEIAEQVLVRVQGALSDLHAADAQYHKDCYANFMAPRSVEFACDKYADRNTDIDNAFNYLKKSDVYLVFDRYHKHSIKGATRMARAGKDASRRHTLAANTPLPPQKVTLTVCENKVQLIDVICNDLKEKVRELPPNNKLIITSKDPTPVEVAHDFERPCDKLRTTHEEADVILVQQMVLCARDGARYIRVISDDTDVFVLLVHFYSSEKLSCHLTLAGTSAGRSIIDIGSTVAKHTNIAEHLLAAHAISGCDTTSFLYGVGKGTVLKTLQAGHSIRMLGDPSIEMGAIIGEATRFIAKCYGVTVEEDMSDVRFQVWTTKMGNKKLSAAPKLKILPPTKEAFSVHVRRAHFQALIWRSALMPDPPSLEAQDYGWSIDEASDILQPVTLPEGVPTVPKDVLQIIKCGCSSQHPCSTARCSCVVAHMPCSVFCSCHGQQECCSQMTRAAMADDNDDNDDEVEDQEIDDTP